MTAEEIFLEALDQGTLQARNVYLDRVCGADLPLRGQVEALLRSHLEAGSFLDAPLLESAQPPDSLVAETPVAEPPVAEMAGACVGPYKLLEQIGEGGMGLVYMAEQQQPVRRLVALKVVKPGMDSRQVIARFEAERQALAVMDHPNIAKVLDAGTTAADRPYFVMELVKGVPITKYCDERQLTLSQRLELFVTVCQAIQHAHQKGIVHRDIKPTNVLVALYDAAPVPKVIDFGVAKAIEQKLTEKTMFTGFGQLIGTLEYMSPEQAQFNALDIDTRSDIYSLGVLLYELLTGTTPLVQSRRNTKAFDETLRIIREEEPPKPSTRLSAPDTQPSIAANRSVAPSQLRRQVTGDLDWIVMKCLEKDRNRRYGTASSLAIDIQRYLNCEPVSASPPSSAYRLRKYLLRNKGTVAVAAGLLVAALAAVGSLGWALRDRAARELEVARAEVERRIDIERQARDALSTARALVAAGKVISAREKLAQAWAELHNNSVAFASLITEVETAQADLDRFLRFLDLVDQANQAETTPQGIELIDESTVIANAATSGGVRERRPEAAVPLFLEALDCYCVLSRNDWPHTLRGGILASQQTEQIRRDIYEILLWLASDLIRLHYDFKAKQPLAPEESAKQALDYLKNAEASHEPTSALYSLRARCWDALGDTTAAEADRQRAAATAPMVAFDHFFRGQAAWDAGKFKEGAEAFEAALRIEPTHYWSMVRLGYCLADSSEPEDHASAVRVFTGCILKRPDHAYAYYYRAFSHHRLGQNEFALADYAASIKLDPAHPRAWYGQANVHFSESRYDVAVAGYTKALELNPDFWLAWCGRGAAYNSLQQDDKAVVDYSKAIELNPQYAPAWAGRGVSYNDLNQPETALADFNKAIALNPQYAYAWNGRGTAHQKLNRRKEALADFDKAIELDPKMWRAWQNRGSRLTALGHEDQALAAFSKAIELKPDDAPARLDRALAYKNSNESEKAVADFSKAIEIDPTLPRAWHGRADCYYRLGRYDEALADYSKSIELDPKTSRAWYARALVHNKLKQPEKALADYSKAIELNPRDASSHSNLAWLLTTCPVTSLRDPQRAVALAEKAVELAPRQGLFWHTLGVTRYRVDRWEAAVAALEKAMTLRGEDPIDGFVLAMAHWKLGRHEQAQTAYQDVVRFMERHKEDIEKDPRYLETLLSFRAEAETLLGPCPSNE